MNRRITAHPMPGTQIPVAAVPSQYIWEVVEYLAFRRTRVEYSYSDTHFYVRFPNLDIPAAQEIMDDWAQSEAMLTVS